MRYSLVIFLSFFCFWAIGQKIEYRNDSLLIENFYVDAQTPNLTIDSLLKSKGESIISNDDNKINPTTGKSVVLMTDFYFESGVFFRRYDFDKTALTVGIRMLSRSNLTAQAQTGLVNSYKGEVLIEGNYMNEKKDVSQLTNLKNCEVIFRYLSTSSRDYLMQGDISRGKNMITIFFDEYTNDVTSIFINLNFPGN